MKKLIFNAAGVMCIVIISMAFTSPYDLIYCFSPDGAVPSPAGMVCNIPISDLKITIYNTGDLRYCNAVQNLTCRKLNFVAPTN
ncbi:hypothetical protein MMC2321_01151 [Chitinophaga sp. MM2321]